MATAGAIGTKIAFSHVDMVKRLEELAKAAGVEPPTMPEINDREANFKLQTHAAIEFICDVLIVALGAKKEQENG